MSARRYTGETVDVTFDGVRCIHSAACIRGAPEVFDTDRRPWIMPDGAADADHLVAVVQRCPTGALHAERHDDGPEEETDGGPTRITVLTDGPLALRGRVTVGPVDHEDEPLRDTRVALCRCGRTGAAPLCDGSHADGFTDGGGLPDELPAGEVLTDPGVDVTIRPRPGGPLKVTGPVEVTGSDGRVWRGTDCALCRCGRSDAKPFCDGSHRALRTG